MPELPPESHPVWTSWQLYKRLLGQIAPYKKIFAASIVGMLIAAATEPAFGKLMGPLINGAFGGDAHARLWVPASLIGLFIVRGVASFVNDYYMSWLSSQVVLNLRQQMFAHLLNLPVSYYDAQSAGNLISKITSDVNNVTAAGVNIVTVVVKDTVTLLGLLGLLTWISWQLTLICFVLIPIIGLIIRFASRRMRGLSRGQQISNGLITQSLDEAIQCQRVVKVFGGHAYEAQRFGQVASSIRRFAVKQAASSSLNGSIVQLLVAVALALIIYTASNPEASDKMTAGDFTSYMASMLLLFPPFKRITSINDTLQRGLTAAESVFSFLALPTENNQGTQSLSKVTGALRFEAVCLQYPSQERLALNAINLEISAGETIALVGASGGGKTSLVNLIPRFYSPTSGSIYLDNIEISQLELQHLREQIAMVSQEVVLFNDTLAANIAYGKLGQVQEQEIIAAAQAAYAWEFIQEMPEGLQTIIGDNGVRLSGGQRQRLAIARAFLKNAPILILDEATSALDTQSERHVQAALEALMQNRTTLVIAHRLSTIEKADRIIVMQKGSIVEQGKHLDLLAKNGIYANLHNMQFNENGA